MKYPNFKIVNGNIRKNNYLRDLVFDEIVSIQDSSAISSYYSGITSITSVSFPELKNVTDNGLQYAFDNCTELTTILFSKLTTAGKSAFYYAFRDCTKLDSIYFNELTTVDESTFNRSFKNCTSLTSISFPKLLNAGHSSFYYAFENCSRLTSISFPKLIIIEGMGLYGAFENCTGITGEVSFPELTTATDYGLYYAFRGCTGITSVKFPEATNLDMNSAFDGCIGITGEVSFPKLTSLTESRSMETAFRNCTGITRVSFPKLTSVRGCINTFQNCIGIQSIYFPELSSIEYNGMKEAFSGCTGITGAVYFPELTTIDSGGLSNTFKNCTKITELHFRSDMQSKVGSNKYGATNATLYFDLLGCTCIEFVTNVPYCKIYVDGVEEPINPVHVYIFTYDTDHVYHLYSPGYCIYKGLINTPSVEYDKQTLTENVTLTTEGCTCTLNITVPEHSLLQTTDLAIDYIVDGITFKTDTFSHIDTTTDTVQISTSVIVPENTEVTYIVRAYGYDVATDTIVPTNNTINITLDTTVGEILEFSYPFKTNTKYLTNLVDNNNFIVLDPLQTPGSCIVSGPKSYHVANGFSSGYIKFKTPDTDNEDLLTLSVTCTSYTDYYEDDFGTVFINTTGTIPTSNVAIQTYAGNINSTYGDILFQGRRGSSSNFTTVTRVLEPNTVYYLCFYYKKNGSKDYNWDRLAIKNIKLPVEISRE